MQTLSLLQRNLTAVTKRITAVTKRITAVTKNLGEITKLKEMRTRRKNWNMIAKVRMEPNKHLKN